MPLEYRHPVQKDMSRIDGSAAGKGTWGFACVEVLIDPNTKGESIRSVPFRSTDHPTKECCEDRLASHVNEHETGELMPSLNDHLRKHGFVPAEGGGTRKLTQAELLKHLNKDAEADEEDED
jgi:hypothetical protein